MAAYLGEILEIFISTNTRTTCIHTDKHIHTRKYNYETNIHIYIYNKRNKNIVIP